MAPISLKKGIIDEVTEELIASVTSLEKGTENFNLSLEFALSNFRFHRFLDVNSFDVKRRLVGLAEKFSVHCQHDKAKHLKELTDGYLNSPLSATQYVNNTEEHHGILSLLLSLSESPVLKDYSPSKKESVAPEDNINWTEYLLEGEEELEIGIYVSDEQRYALEESDEDEISVMKSSQNMVIDHYAPSDVISRTSERLSETEQHQIDLSWLQMNIISQYWKENPIYLRQLESGYDQSSFGALESTQNMLQTLNASIDSLAINKLTEKVIVRETLWMLQGIESTFVYLFVNKQYQVRRNIVMGHTSQASLQNVLEYFAAIGTKMHILRNFVTEMFDVRKSNLRTLRAFGYSINSYLKKVKKGLSVIENEIVKGRKVYTCLTLMEATKEMAKNTKLVFELFNVCVTNAKDTMTSPGEYMAHVINTFYSAVCRLDEHGCACVNQLVVILPMFLETIRPFLNDLGNWISFGKLPVVNTEEFFIEKSPDTTQQDSDTWYKTFRIRSRNNDNQSDVFVPKFLVKDVKKILLAGKSRGLLEAATQNSTEMLRSSFDEEFIQKFLESLGLSALNNDKIDFDDTVSGETNDILILKSQFNFLLFENFRFVFQSVYERACSRYGTSDTSTDTSNTDTNNPKCLFEILQQNSSQFREDSSSRLLIKQIFEDTLQDLIDIRYEQASLSLINMLKYRYNLYYHISVMQNFFFMEAGDVMHMFYSEIFAKIRNREIWQNTSYLTSVLHEALFLRFPKLVKTLTAGIKQIDPIKVAKRTDDIQSIDSIILRYQMEWPLTIIFDKKVEDKYNAIFGFLLQVKRALWSLEQLRISDLSRDKNPCHEPQSRLIQKLFVLRVRLLHFVQSFHVYIMTRILHSSGLEFKERLSGAKDFEEVLGVHNDFLEKVYDRCLLSSKVGFAKQAITRILNLCLNFQKQWDKKLSEISDENIHSIATEFDKCSHFIQSFLNSLIKRGSFPHLELLSLSLRT